MTFQKIIYDIVSWYKLLVHSWPCFIVHILPVKVILAFRLCKKETKAAAIKPSKNLLYNIYFRFINIGFMFYSL